MLAWKYSLVLLNKTKEEDTELFRLFSSEDYEILLNSLNENREEILFDLKDYKFIQISADLTTVWEAVNNNNHLTMWLSGGGKYVYAPPASVCNKSSRSPPIHFLRLSPLALAWLRPPTAQLSFRWELVW